METTSTKAMLIGADDFDAASGAVSTIISREEIEQALRSDEPAVLMLDVVRAAAAGSPRKRETLSVQWDRWDLERLLKVGSGDSVRLSFPHDELERALDASDVEAHGLREAAAILTVAAAAALSGAAAADASNLAGGGGAGGGIDTGIVAIHDEQGSAARGIETAPTHDEAGLSARGIEDTAQAASAVHDETTLASRGIEAAAVHEEATLAARGITTPAVHDEAGLVERGIVPGAVHDEATLAARGIETPVADDGGWTIEAPSVDPGTAAAVGGAAGGAILLITAAGFALRRSHSGPRPV